MRIRAPLAVVLLAMLCSLSLAAEPANLVKNPSLEGPIDASGYPEGWGKFFSQPAGAFKFDFAQGGRTGKLAMTIEGDGQFGAMPANRVPLDPTKRYVARGWVKVTGGKQATADVKLHYYAEGGAYLGQTRIGFASPGSDQWQLVTVTDRAGEFPQAKLIGLAIACTGDAKARYDDLELLAFDKKDLPADFDAKYGITRSPQLALLNRRVGTWNTKTTIKPCLWVAQGAESTGVETINWILGGQMLEFRQRSSAAADESLGLMTYDARDRVYRTWRFDSNGNVPRSESIGRWDEASQTFTIEADDKEVASVVRLKLVGDDKVQWQGVWKDKRGQIVLDIEGESTRQAKK
jgi:hypothetical protein